MNASSTNQQAMQARRELDERGFVAVTDMFTADEIAELRDVIHPLLGRFDDLVGRLARDIGKLPSGQHRQPEIDRPTRLIPHLFQTIVYKKVRQFASEMLGHRARCSFNHVICKEPNSNHETPWHQDQAYLGPKISLGTINFWIPLQDVDAENGCLSYVPGSHTLALQPHEHFPGDDGHARITQVNKEEEVIPLRAGDFIIHTPMTLHRGLPNVSDAPRLAWALHFNRLGRAAYLLPQNLPGLVERVLR